MQVSISNQKNTLDFLRDHLQKSDVLQAYKIIAKIFGYTSKEDDPEFIHSQDGIATYSPREFSQKPSQSCRVWSLFTKNGQDYYCLKVSDDSMSDIDIQDKDLILIKRTEEVKNGDIILSVIDGEARLKKYRKFKDRIELHSANSKYPPIIVTDADDFRIAGVFAGHFHD